MGRLYACLSRQSFVAEGIRDESSDQKGGDTVATCSTYKKRRGACSVKTHSPGKRNLSTKISKSRVTDSKDECCSSPLNSTDRD